MIRHLAQVALSVAGLTIAAAWPAFAVTVEIEVTTRSEPVPGASITFETADGTPVPLTEVTQITEESQAGTMPDSVGDGEPTTATPGTDTASGVPPAEEVTQTTAPEEGMAANGEAPDAGTGTDMVSGELGEEEMQIVSEPEVDDPAVPEETAVAEEGAIKADDTGKAVGELANQFVGHELFLVIRDADQVVKRQPVTVEDEGSRLRIKAYDPIDALVSLEIAQEGQCRRGSSCDVRVTITNDGTGIYIGPLFLLGEFPGAAGQSDGEAGRWYCVPAGRGQHACYSKVSIEPGASVEQSIAVDVPVRARESQSCVRLMTLDEGAQDVDREIIRANQVGLVAQGFDAGTADGLMGPRTRGAIADFYGESVDMAEVDSAGLFAELFQFDPADLLRLGVEQDRSCVRVALIGEPPPTKTKSVRQRTPEKARTRQDSRREKRENILENPAVQFGIGIGIGIGIGKIGDNERRGHKRQQRERREWQQEFRE